MRKTSTPNNSQSMAETGKTKQTVSRVSSKEQPSQGCKTRKATASARKEKVQQKTDDVLSKQVNVPSNAQVSRLITTVNQGMSTFFLNQNRCHHLH